MSKKIVFVLLLCIVALSCAYAGKAVIVAQASPFSFQSVAASGGTYKSTYGFGASGGIRVDVYGVPKRNADRPARGNYAAAGGNINRQKWEFMMRR